LGLEHLRHPANPGLRELLRVSSIDEGRAPSAGQVAFQLAPRINAAGRLASADLAAQLFLTADPGKARRIARQLDLLNTRRQSQEKELVECLDQLVQASPKMLEQRILVLEGETWPRGVIGIAAARLVESYHRPAVVISSDGGVGHGSCRSVPGFNITSALGTAAAHLLDRFGGHAMAAGFSLDAKNIPQLRQRLYDHCRGELDEALLIPRASADLEIGPEDLDRSLFDSLRLLEPFGMGNPRPVFLVRDLCLTTNPVTLKGRHLKLQLGGENLAIEAIWWRSGHLLDKLAGCGRSIDVLGKLELHRWSGQETLRLNVNDIRPGGSSRAG
jgi:single-stranded-DNA-specific exonuclease